MPRWSLATSCLSNSEKFVDFWNFYRFIITCARVNWNLIVRQQCNLGAVFWMCLIKKALTSVSERAKIIDSLNTIRVVSCNSIKGRSKSAALPCEQRDGFSCCSSLYTDPRSQTRKKKKNRLFQASAGLSKTIFYFRTDSLSCWAWDLVDGRQTNWKKNFGLLFLAKRSLVLN